MKALRILLSAVLLLSFAGGNSFAADDKAKKQAEIRKVTQASLQKFYKSDPTLKRKVAKAPGYGVFTTYGLSFIFGGAGGKGLVHERAKKRDTFMSMAQASAGIQIGASESETLIIFNSAKSMHDFIDSGWELAGGGGATAGADGKGSAGSASSVNVVTGAEYYTLTKNGLQAGGALAGTKFWKDEELN